MQSKCDFCDSKVSPLSVLISPFLSLTPILSYHLLTRKKKNKKYTTKKQ